jgi:hypothetical protein
MPLRVVAPKHTTKSNNSDSSVGGKPPTTPHNSDSSGDEGLARVKVKGRPHSSKVPRPPNAWLVALKEYNKSNEVYHIPKKYTKEYEHVRSLMK